jgi:outer membrane lipoprotein-sorting protein
MQLRFCGFVVCLVLAGPGVIRAGTDSVQQVLARMDKAANDFKYMTAQVTYIEHTDILNDDSTQVGRVTMKKVQPGEVQGRVDFTLPDPKIITFEKRKFQEYYPKINTLQVFDLNKHGELLDRSIMIGFGTSGTELAKDYDVSVLGTEKVDDRSAIRLQLIPRAAEAKQYETKVELWIPDQGDPYPLRRKIYEPSKNYVLVTFSDIKINPPLKPDALELKLPAGFKTEHPGQ